MKNFATITAKYSNVPYKLGSYDVNVGLDCLTLIDVFYKDIGKEFDKFKDSEFKINYKGKEINVLSGIDVCESKEELGEAALMFIRKALVKTDKLKKGCVCIYKLSDVEFPGIYVGNNKHLCLFENGARILPIPQGNILEIYE